MSTFKKEINEPSHVVDLQDSGQISAIHFSTNELTQNILLVAFPNKILVAQLTFNDEFVMSKLAEFNNGVTCTSLALSPDTCVSAMPINLIFCTASIDFKLRVFESDLNNKHDIRILSGHSDYINEISYDPENNFIASVSDDNTARIWSIEDYSCSAVLYLNSPGMSACWHREDSSKLMIAEKLGIIRFYNVNTQKPILSLDFGKPLSSAHWSPADTQCVYSLHLGELVQWDITRPSQPALVKLVHGMPGGFVRINNTGELIATVNKLEGSTKVMLKNLQQRLSATALLPTNVTWHNRLSICCLGDDRKLYFWKVI